MAHHPGLLAGIRQEAGTPEFPAKHVFELEERRPVLTFGELREGTILIWAEGDGETHGPYR